MDAKSPDTKTRAIEEHRKKVFDCRIELPDWRLHITHLARREERDLGNVMTMAVQGACAYLRSCFPDGRLEQSRTVAAMRESLCRMGIDPEVTRPSSELELEDLLRRDARTSRSLAEDFLGLLVAKSHAPWSVLDRAQLQPPLVFRPGAEGETLPDKAGDFDCAGLPVLADQGGVIASPWTRRPPGGADENAEPVFVCYVPRDLFRTVEPRSHMGRTVWLTWAYRFVFERSFRHHAPAG